MQKYYSEIQKIIEAEDSNKWQVLLTTASVEDVQAFQENALWWNQW